MTLLETLTVSASGVNSSSLSQDYINLYIIIRGITANDNLDMNVRFNSDSGNNYQTRGVFTDTAAASTNGAATDKISGIATVGSGITADGIIIINRYTDTTRRLISTELDGGVGGPTLRYQKNLCNYTGSSAISTIQFSRADAGISFTAGTIYIYGVK